MKSNIKKGSILIELLIASAISSGILMLLVNMVSQVNRSVQTMDRIASVDMRTLLLQHQLERDISGAFVPYMKGKKQPGKSSTEDKADKSAKKKKNSKADKSKNQKKEKFEDVPLKKAFHSKNKGENIELLTFVTTNPLVSHGKFKPRIARVVYRLVLDKARSKGLEKRSFKLLRQEATKLDFAEFAKEGQNKIRSYEVVKNIKKLSVEYTVATKKEKKKDQKQEPKVEYKNFRRWTEQEIKKTKKQKPDFCTFKVELWDDLRKTFRSFECNVYMFHGEPKEPKQEKPKQEKKTDKGKKNRWAKRWK